MSTWKAERRHPAGVRVGSTEGEGVTDFGTKRGLTTNCKEEDDKFNKMNFVLALEKLPEEGVWEAERRGSGGTSAKVEPAIASP